jgi:peptide chain release factor 1
MYNKLESLEKRYLELSNNLSDAKIISDQDVYPKLMKEFSSLEPIIEKYREFKKVSKDILDAHEMLESNSDREFEKMLLTEITDGDIALEDIKRDLKILLLPKDPNDDRSVIIEIRGGAGGDEAALFAGVLYRAYIRYAERHYWKAEVLDSNPTELGGFKEVVFALDAKGAYSKLKFESGVHRVQRVPATESSGRIHTSTITVAVLPEVDDVEIDINPSDLEIDTYRSGGAGGQHVNKTESSIRISHVPSGIVVTCQDERSQHKNKEKAMKILRSKLFDMMQAEQNSKLAQERKSQVGTGDRSERIRTYNYAQGRVTDHRIGLTLYKLNEILDGDFDELIDTLNTEDQARKLSNGVF